MAFTYSRIGEAAKQEITVDDQGGRGYMAIAECWVQRTLTGSPCRWRRRIFPTLGKRFHRSSERTFAFWGRASRAVRRRQSLLRPARKPISAAWRVVWLDSNRRWPWLLKA